MGIRRISGFALALVAGPALLAGCSEKADSCSNAECVPRDTGMSSTDTGHLLDAGALDATVLPPDSGPISRRSYLYVVSMMQTGASSPDSNPSVVPGFNLDDRTSTGDDEESCRHEDYTAPPPDSITGVDNVLGPVLSSFETSFQINATAATTIAAGTFLMLVEVSEVESLENDDDVTVDFLFGVLPEGTFAPELGEDGLLAQDQLFDIDSRSFDPEGVPFAHFPGSQIVNGRVITGGEGGFTVSIPYSAEETISLNIHRSQNRFDISEGALGRGVIGGGLNVEELVAEMSPILPETITEAFLRSILRSAADLEKVGAECTEVSVGLVFEAVPAQRGETVVVYEGP